MTVVLYFIYVLVCLFLIAVVLLQSGKGADLASAFGAGGSQAAIGARGAATALSRLTTYAAIAFMVLALVLAIRKSRDVSLIERAGSPAPAAATTAPATKAAPMPATTGPAAAPAPAAATPLLPESPVPPSGKDGTPASPSPSPATTKGP